MLRFWQIKLSCGSSSQFCAKSGFRMESSNLARHLTFMCKVSCFAPRTLTFFWPRSSILTSWLELRTAHPGMERPHIVVLLAWSILVLCRPTTRKVTAPQKGKTKKRCQMLSVSQILGLIHRRFLQDSQDSSSASASKAGSVSHELLRLFAFSARCVSPPRTGFRGGREPAAVLG